MIIVFGALTQLEALFTATVQSLSQGSRADDLAMAPSLFTVSLFCRETPEQLHESDYNGAFLQTGKHIQGQVQVNSMQAKLVKAMMTLTRQCNE